MTVEGDENPGTVYFVDEDYGDRVRLVPVKNPWGSGVNEPKKYVKVVSNTKFKVAKSAIIGATEVKRIFPEWQRAPIRLMKGKNGHFYVVSADSVLDYGKNYRVASDKYDEVVAKIMPNSVRNAKFKVGDEVVFKANGHRGEVKKIDGGKIGVRWGFSSSIEWHNEDELQKSANSVRSTNAVVAKALNAVRNAWTDAPDAATAKRDIEQTVRKAAEIAKRRSGAKATYKLTPNDNYWCGYIELTFDTEEEAKKYNPYYLFDELGDNKSILPKWSWAISAFNYQKNGKVVKIFVGRLAT